MPDRPGKLPPAPRRRKLRVDILLALLVVLLAGILLARHSETPHLPAEVAVATPSSPSIVCSDAGNQQIKPGKSLRFLSLNAQNYFVETEQARTAIAPAFKKDDEREAVADVIASAKPSVVGLSEMGGPCAILDLQQRLVKRGLHYPYTKVLVRQGEPRALAILSQYPIIHDDSEADVPLSGNTYMMRGLLDVTIQAGEAGLFRFVGAHLKSRFNDPTESSAELRRREAYAIASRVHQITEKQPETPLLVFGDWNDSPTEPSVRILQKGISAESGLKRLRPKDSRDENWTLHFRAGFEYCVYDYIFVNKVLANRMRKSHFCGIVDVQAAAKASDHRALWCELR